MKTIKNVCIIAFISIATFACSSDDDSSGDTTGDNQAKIIGSWRYTSSTTNGEADTLNDCDLMDTATFTTSQVTFAYFEGVNCEDTGSESVNYTINGNNILLSLNNETFTSEILTLNSTTLTLKDSDGGDVYTDTYTKL
ncbi:lipocalin-like domain-containing protein [Psychroserpens luteus]|uniref:Lipocalin family protein n=1 Tax=Psychroserpens luteus TaxID=1434066 RepID=A0ABW5ZPC3_9FLAO|nr:lipocalin family protein [Psychroserpens luteus]